MPDAVERNAAADHISVAPQAFLPKIFGHHRHVGGLLFLRQKIATADRLDAEDIEVVRRHFAAEKLNGIAHSGQSERDDVFAGEPVENLLGRAEMLKARHRDREFQQIALPRIRVHVHDAFRLFEWKAAQKQIVDQTEDGSVQPNPERERDYSEKSKSGRFAKLA